MFTDILGDNMTLMLVLAVLFALVVVDMLAWYVYCRLKRVLKTLSPASTNAVVKHDKTFENSGGR